MFIKAMKAKIFNCIQDFAATAAVRCGKCVLRFLLSGAFVEHRYRMRVSAITRQRVAIEAHVFGRHALGECCGDGAPITAIQNAIAIRIGIGVQIGTRR